MLWFRSLGLSNGLGNANRAGIIFGDIKGLFGVFHWKVDGGLIFREQGGTPNFGDCAAFFHGYAVVSHDSHDMRSADHAFVGQGLKLAVLNCGNGLRTGVPFGSIGFKGDGSGMNGGAVEGGFAGDLEFLRSRVSAASAANPQNCRDD